MHKYIHTHVACNFSVIACPPVCQGATLPTCRSCLKDPLLRASENLEPGDIWGHPAWQMVVFVVPQEYLENALRKKGGLIFA